MIHWSKWKKVFSTGSLPSYIRAGTFVGNVQVEVALTRAEEGSKLWHEAIRINGELVYQQSLNHHESVYDAKSDICDRAEFWLEHRFS